MLDIDSVKEDLLKSRKTVEAHAVLGCVLADPAVGKVVADELKPDDFLDPRHRHVFTAIQSVVSRGQTPDIHTVAGHFTDDELNHIGGIPYLEQLKKTNVNPERIRQHVANLREQTVRRSLTLGITKLYSDIVRQAPTNEILQNLDGLMRKAMSTVDDEVGDVKTLFELYRAQPPVTGIPTGFTRLDEMTGGMKPATVWVIAAYAGTGKTTIANRIINNICISSNDPILYLSLEMKTIRITGKMARDLTFLGKREEDIMNHNLHILNKKRTIPQIEYAIMRYKPKIVFIDYAQLMYPGMDIVKRMGLISPEFIRIAQEHDCCIVSLSQVSNDFAKTPDTKVMGAKGGGDLPAAADVYVELVAEADDGESMSESRIIEMHIKKNRDGALGRTHYIFDTRYGMIRPDAPSIPVSKPPPQPTNEIIEWNDFLPDV